jgi:hypothetical protein
MWLATTKRRCDKRRCDKEQCCFSLAVMEPILCLAPTDPQPAQWGHQSKGRDARDSLRHPVNSAGTSQFVLGPEQQVQNAVDSRKNNA